MLGSIISVHLFLDSQGQNEAVRRHRRLNFTVYLMARSQTDIDHVGPVISEPWIIKILIDSSMNDEIAD